MHKPVLLAEVIKYLHIRSGDKLIDGTVGRAGHLREILKKIGPRGKVLAIDRDPLSLSEIKNNLASEPRITWQVGNFKNLKRIVRQTKFGSVDGLLLDLGLSSWQLEKSERGFSFRSLEPLDMRFNRRQSLKASQIINHWSRDELWKIFRDYSEEKYSWRVANWIVRAREKAPIETTEELATIIKQAIPFSRTRRGQKQRVLARLWQALRLAVNGELDSLEGGLVGALSVLKPGGRLVVVSFHSLEDRIVKRFFRAKEKDNLLTILTKKPLVPGSQELENNPRSRSAKLRVAVKN